MDDPFMTIRRRTCLVAILFTLAIRANGGSAGAAPTPVPGGANQRSGVSGNLSQTLFNGTYRVRAMSLKEFAPADNASGHMTLPKAGERALVLRMTVSNGTPRAVHGYFNATIVDANDVTHTGNILDDGWQLEPGAAARSMIGFTFPADFVPTRILLVEAARSNPRAFRIALRPGDLPAAASAPAPSATQ